MIALDKPILQITWTMQDIFDSFKEHIGREPTEDDLQQCIKKINWKTMQDRSIEYGWNFIYQTIDDIQKQKTSQTSY